MIIFEINLDNNNSVLEDCDPRSSNTDDIEIDLRRRLSRLKSGK